MCCLLVFVSTLLPAQISVMICMVSFAWLVVKPSACPPQDFRCVPCQSERPFTPRMDHRSQNSSDGGGGRLSEGRPQAQPLQTQEPLSEPDLTDGQPPHTPAVLSLDQIEITGSSNEYTDGPVAARRSPAPEHQRPRSSPVTVPISRPGVDLETPGEKPNNLRNLPSLMQDGSRNPSTGGVPRVRSAEDPLSGVRISVGGSASGQRLLGDNQVIRTQPKRAELSSEELKPLNSPCEPVTALLGTGGSKIQGAHSKCKDCGRCRCPECSRPRTLPSCWMCGRRCVCSAQSAVEYITCVCCVKGLFYHCSSDDEDTCADKPFSCRQSHCCVRWSAVSLLSLLFPCLLCYLPAKGCVAVCQSCYDRVSRPGCRC
uniref:Protein sprouty homolog 2 n=1 Tax=Takifugu rubripes TaxID=31033 RepID=A0A674PNK6_TAKRU